MTPDTITPQTIECTLCLLGLVGMIASYLYGRARTERKYKQQIQAHIDEIERLSENEMRLERGIRIGTHAATEWQRRCIELQQEIEAHVHEVHEEAERPHVDWNTADDMIWESIARMKDNDQ